MKDERQRGNCRRRNRERNRERKERCWKVKLREGKEKNTGRR